jgi:hypothetical protein
MWSTNPRALVGWLTKNTSLVVEEAVPKHSVRCGQQVPERGREYNVLGGLRQAVFAKPVPEHGWRHGSSGESATTMSDESSVRSGESSARAWRGAARGRRGAARAQRGSARARRELGDERRELGDESPVWPETWSSCESLVTSLTRSNESSARSP